jgi:hypothetical protein
MVVVTLALLIAAFVLFILAALSVSMPRVVLGWAGLACWVLKEILERIR